MPIYQEPRTYGASFFMRVDSSSTGKGILSGMEDVGPHFATMPVIDKLRPAMNSGILASGPSKRLLTERNDYQIIKGDMALSTILADMPINVFYSGVSAYPNVELYLMNLARNKGLPIVLQADLHSIGKRLFEDLGLSRREVPDPDYIIVPNATVARRERDFFPRLKGRILKLGSPAFDEFATSDKDEVRARVRHQLNISNGEQVVIFMGSKSKDYSFKALEDLTLALKEIDFKGKLMVTEHPSAQNMGFDQVVAPIARQVVDGDDISNSDLRKSADLVVGFSTAVIQAAFEGTNNIAFRNQELVTVKEGITPVVSTYIQMLNWVKKLLLNEKDQARQAKAMAKLTTDGLATERVADLLLKL